MTWVHLMLIFLGILSLLSFFVAGAITESGNENDGTTGGTLVLGLILFLIFIVWTINHTAFTVNCERDGGVLNAANQCVVEKLINEEK